MNIDLYNLKIAVLFLIVNRLNTIRQVFAEIKKAKPPRLYIASDGARDDVESETQKVKDVRDFVVDNIDWDCEVKTLFRDGNLGCGLSVKSSIDWFFKQEEMGIILEDDCVPNESFFRFCEELLIKYEADDRVGMISGNNHISYQPNLDSYLFSRYKGCWGWATYGNVHGKKWILK
jgi:GR25 family glycosyltransferase involved in LPS biosynthesis